MLSRFKELTSADIASVTALKSWVSEGMTHYLNRDIPDEDLLIFIDYLESKIRETSEEIDKRFWLSQLENLRKRIGAMS